MSNPDDDTDVPSGFDDDARMGRGRDQGGGFPLFRPPNWLPGRQGVCLGWVAGFSRPKRSGDPGATFFIAALTFQEAAVRGHASLKEVLKLQGRCRGEQHGNRCLSRHLPGKSNFPRTKASFWREIRSSAFASQDRLYSTSLSAPPSRQNQLQVDGGLRWDIEQCPPRLVRAQKRPALRPLPPTSRPSCSCLLPTRPRCLL